MSRLATFLVPGSDLGPAIDLVRRAEALGYESVWLTHAFGRDAFLVLAAYGAATSRIGLATGVMPVYPRHPIATAQAALTLSELTNGRFRLGLGVSSRPSMERALGLPLREPLEVMREYVTILRAAFDGGVEFDGEHYRVHCKMNLPRTPTAPSIYLAALGARMAELAGEIADGVVLWLCPPSYIDAVVLPAVERGRRRAGKPLEGFEIVAAVPLAVTDQRDTARNAFGGELVRYLALPFYRRMFEAAGLGPEVQRFDASGEVTNAFAAAVGVIGTADASAAVVRGHRDAGVTLPAVRPIGGTDAPWARRTLESVATA
jgi:F420-dependent oxidoreductase-like protein